MKELVKYDNMFKIDREVQKLLHQLENLFDRCYFKNSKDEFISIYSDEVFESKEDKENFLSLYKDMIFDEYDNNDIREDLYQTLSRFDNLTKLLSLIQIFKFKTNSLYEEGE